MKRIRVAGKSAGLFLLLCIIIFSNPLLGQTDSSGSFSLQLSCNKTTSIVFPQIIKSIDCGSRDLLVQKVAGVENVLQLKAARENFPETNLTVITAEGKLYSFIARYSAQPLCLQIQADSAASVFETIASQKRSVHGIRDASYEIILRLKGLYIEKEIIYYQLELENRSGISYDIDMLRFFIKDKRQSRRTASQELEQTPVIVYGNTVSVAALASQSIVVALQKFTIPDKKKLYITMTEKNGGRTLRLTVSNRHLVKAKPLRSIE